MVIEELSDSQYRVYSCGDGRYRVYDKTTKKVTSYPRLIMERKLGRKLDSIEQVHHENCNPMDNDDTNLSISTLGEHQRFHATKYEDMIVQCEYCGKDFLWTAKQQRTFHCNRSRTKYKNKPRNGPFCSRYCSGKHSTTV